MLKLPAIFNRKRRAAEESDFGRRFGWFIERDGARIGELDYIRWDSAAQFWHEYRLTWRRAEDAVVGPDAWIAAKLVLRSRRYADVVVDTFVTSPERDGGVIAVRGAYAPEVRLGDDDDAKPFAAANGGGPSRLQLARLVAAVAEIGSLSAMATWQPMNEEQVQSLIDEELVECTPEQRAIFAMYRVPLRATPIKRHGNLESVFVAAQGGDEVMHYEDVEEGWNFSTLTAKGHIAQHWCNQDELKYALWRWTPRSG